jgi:hypothetical protein
MVEESTAIFAREYGAWKDGRNEKKCRIVASVLLRRNQRTSAGLLLGGEDIAGSEAHRHPPQSLPSLTAAGDSGNALLTNPTGHCLRDARSFSFEV